VSRKGGVAGLVDRDFIDPLAHHPRECDSDASVTPRSSSRGAINAFKAAHQLTDVTVVADVGMISAANQIALQAARLSFILGTKIAFMPDVVRRWRDAHRGEAIPDGQILTQPWPATSAEKARGIPDRVVYYQYRHDRARRTLRGIDE